MWERHNNYSFRRDASGLITGHVYCPPDGRWYDMEIVRDGHRASYPSRETAELASDLRESVPLVGLLRDPAAVVTLLAELRERFRDAEWSDGPGSYIVFPGLDETRLLAIVAALDAALEVK